MGRNLNSGLAVLILSIAAGRSFAWPDPPPTAEPKATPGPPEPMRGPASTVAVPTRDVFDVLRALRHKPPKAEPADADEKTMIAAAPVVSYNPASGVGIGIAGSAAFYKGSPPTTSVSSVLASLTVTSKKQLFFGGKFRVSTSENRWLLQGDDRLAFASQDTYGLGTSTVPDDRINAKFDFVRVNETAYRRVYRRLYLGGGLLYSLHRDVKPGPEFEAAWPGSPYVQYSQARGLPLDSQSSAGASAGLLVDTRDSAINPSRGVYTAVEYLAFFEGFLGGTSGWQQLNVDTRTYVRLSRDARHRLGIWLFANLVTQGEPPYFDLPATSMDVYGRSGRGYVEGRFRGQRLAYGEFEYRWTVTRDGLVGVVAFLNTDPKQRGHGREALRLVRDRRGHRRAPDDGQEVTDEHRIDIGRGQDGKLRVYFGVREAF